MNPSTRCLVVEDDLTSRLILVEILKRFGFDSVDVAVTGHEALCAVKASMKSGAPYHLICLDIMMPRLDGQAVLQEIRRLEDVAGIGKSQRARIVMVTALADKENVLQALRSQCDHYLVKPIDQKQMLSILRQLGFSPS